MVTVSGALPVTTPVTASTVAISGLRLIHLPDNVVSMRLIVCPTHTDGLDGITGPIGWITTAVSVWHPPFPKEMITVPDATGISKPDEDPMVAIPGMLLDHVPPEVAEEGSV
jgi:hypothetical protein